MRQPGSWGQWSCSQITAHEGDQRSLIFERFSFCYFWSDQGRLILEEQYFLPKCHEKNDGLKLGCSLLDCKFGGYLLCVTFCLNKQLCLMDFDRIREGILKGKNYLHFTADWLMICLSMLNSGSVSFVSRTSHLAGNGNNNVNFQPKWFRQGTLGRAFSEKSMSPHQACLAEVNSVPCSALSAVPPRH